ncbi:cell wall anchor protein, partial [Shewanella sp. 10N.286.45.A1]
MQLVLHLSDSLQKLQLINVTTDEFISFDSAASIDIHSQPDGLMQTYIWSDKEVSLTLSYSDNRTATVMTELTNLSNRE